MKKIIIGVLILVLTTQVVIAQEKSKGMNLDNRIHQLTTLVITVGNGSTSQGSGFFIKN